MRVCAATVCGYISVGPHIYNKYIYVICWSPSYSLSLSKKKKMMTQSLLLFLKQHTTDWTTSFLLSLVPCFLVVLFIFLILLLLYFFFFIDCPLLLAFEALPTTCLSSNFDP